MAEERRYKKMQKRLEMLEKECESLRTAASEADTYRQIAEEYEAQLNLLKQENAGNPVQRSPYGNPGTGLLSAGRERELYENEQYEVVMDILSSALNGMQDGSRRMDVLKSVLESNPSESIPKKRREQVKGLFRQYGQFGPALEKKLAELGINTVRSSRHYCLTYAGDPRYTATVSATPSDSRSALNVASSISNMMF